MLRWYSKRIMAKLTTQFFIVGLIPLVLLGGITYFYSRSVIEAKAFNHLSAINDIKKQQIEQFLDSGMKNLEALSRSQQLQNALAHKAYREMSPLLQYFVKIFDYRHIYLLSNTGALLHEVSGQNNKEGSKPGAEVYTDALTRIRKAVQKADAQVMSDIIQPENAAHASMFMGTPVYDNAGNQLALLIFQIDAAQINDFLKGSSGLGKTGRTYLVGSDYLLRSQTYSLDKSESLKKKIQTMAVEQGINNKGGTQRITDYRNTAVLSAYEGLNMKERFGTDFNWAIISQIDASEALGMLNRLGLNIVWTILVLMVLIGAVGYFQSRVLARPIRSLSYHIMAIDEGNFTMEMPEDYKSRGDEIGMLVKSFAKTAKKFQQQIKQLSKSTRQLLTSTSQISTTASQLATSASETSSSISEVTTTVEEVKQTSQLASDKAEHVYKSSENTSKISLAGKQATENTTAGINRIKEEMNDIAESTIKLSEQTKSIEEIINTVSDIADQSNILSVNASIEAAKAGEQGKGFAVVAQEVKSLADQSKEATTQVRAILGDIQQATSTAVMATERGSKTVEEAIELAEQSGVAIERLERQVNESSDSASQIMASNQQQLSGMDQLSQAMESINDATQQNLDGVKQLEEAIKGLEEFAQTIREIISRYKV